MIEERIGRQVLVEEKIGTGICGREDWGRYWLKRGLIQVLVEERIGTGIG